MTRTYVESFKLFMHEKCVGTYNGFTTKLDGGFESEKTIYVY